jgi:hypothetical protein
MDGRHRFVFSVDGIEAIARATQTAGYIRPRHLHNSGLVALLPHGDAVLI